MAHQEVPVQRGERAGCRARGQRGVVLAALAVGLVLRWGDYHALIGASFGALALCAVAALVAAHRTERASAMGQVAAG